MKTATIPSLRVDPQLRAAVESVLENGETLSGFVELAIRNGVEKRQTQREFIARGLASLDEARRTGIYISSEEVMKQLEKRLADAKAGASSMASARK